MFWKSLTSRTLAPNQSLLGRGNRSFLAWMAFVLGYSLFTALLPGDVGIVLYLGAAVLFNLIFSIFFFIVSFLLLSASASSLPD